MLLISLSTAPSHSAPHIKANERATKSFYFTQKTNRVRKSSDHQPKSLSPMHVSMNGMKLRCKVSEWEEVRYNDCIQPALLRTGFPAPAAGVIAWCKLLAITGLPSATLTTILGPAPASTECWLLMWTTDNVNPLLSSTPATADTGDVQCYAREGEQTHSFHLLVLYDAILSSVLFPQIRVLHSLGWLWLNWTASKTLSAMLSILFS